jgi:hypothetical protein
VLIHLTLGSVPVSLTNKKRHSYSPTVDLPSSLVHNQVLCLDYRARLALVVYTQNLCSHLEVTTFTGWRQRLQESDGLLSMNDLATVELWYIWNGGTFGVLGSVEVDDFCRGSFEWQDDRVSRKGAELRMKFLASISALSADRSLRVR